MLRDARVVSYASIWQDLAPPPLRRTPILPPSSDPRGHVDALFAASRRVSAVLQHHFDLDDDDRCEGFSRCDDRSFGRLDTSRTGSRRNPGVVVIVVIVVVIVIVIVEIRSGIL